MNDTAQALLTILFAATSITVMAIWAEKLKERGMRNVKTRVRKPDVTLRVAYIYPSDQRKN